MERKPEWAQEYWAPEILRLVKSPFQSLQRLVLTVVGPERLATIKMVDDQQNVDPVMFSAHRLRISLYWDSIRRPSESGLSTLAVVLLKAGIKVW